MTGLARRFLGRAAQGSAQWLVISPDRERAPLQHVAEVLDGQEDAQELSVEGRVLGLSGGELLGKEGNRRAFNTAEGEDCSNGDQGGICGQRQRGGGIRIGVDQLDGVAEGVFGCDEGQLVRLEPSQRRFLGRDGGREAVERGQRGCNPG